MLRKLQQRIYANKVAKGFNVASDYHALNEEICRLAEELGELSRAHRRGDADGVVDGVVDLLVYRLGLLEILGVDGDEAVRKVLDEIEARQFVRTEAGRLLKVPEVTP